MIINEIDGDILDLFARGNSIAHGCNCFHTMGAGIAGQLARKYPIILHTDKQTIYGAHDKLGKYCKVAIGDDLCYNLYTQYEPGPNVDYGAILNAFMALDKDAVNFRTIRNIYIPKIGAGIAGGSWDLISKIIDIATPNTHITVVNYVSSN